MIYLLNGKVSIVGQGFLVVEVGGIGFKLFLSKRDLEEAKKMVGQQARFFCHLRVREDGLDLYGFLSGENLSFFELLNSVSGVGPRSAFSIMDIDGLKNVKAAIKEGRVDLLIGASGVGRKTAERIILELKNKIETEDSLGAVKRMEDDNDIVEVLVGLGYRRDQARAALAETKINIANPETRLKAALKIIANKR